VSALQLVSLCQRDCAGHLRLSGCAGHFWSPKLLPHTLACELLVVEKWSGSLVLDCMGAHGHRRVLANF
jgi:hypothetical protein